MNFTDYIYIYMDKERKITGDKGDLLSLYDPKPNRKT